MGKGASGRSAGIGKTALGLGGDFWKGKGEAKGGFYRCKLPFRQNGPGRAGIHQPAAATQGCSSVVEQRTQPCEHKYWHQGLTL